MKISFITTIYNEEKTILNFLDSLLNQSRQPNEIIIVDGKSTDKTLNVIKSFEARIKGKKIKYKLLIKKGNRSVGRNEAIKHAHSEVIVCSDSGNILDKDWIKNITKPFSDKKVDVVAGYYKGKSNTVFQKCVIPYALVMEDKVDPKNFLPATRSVAFKKSIWKKVGGFDERFSHNEDYVFARKLKEAGATISFAKDAIVYWQPRDTLKQTFTMLWRFAYGDAEAKIFRKNVLYLFTRYLLGLYFIFLCLLYRSLPGFLITVFFLIIYIIWSIKKNYKYVRDKKAFYILPLLQFTADAAVLSGTLLGLVKRVTQFNYLYYLRHHKFLLTVLLVYSFIECLTLNWGIPNQNHPFPYHMDEWHQLQAVANTFRYGTPNTAGSANGTMFHFLYSGFYLIPFTLFQIVDPFSLQLDNWHMREKIFEILRLQTILFGLLSIFTLYKIAELINASKKITVILFTVSPIWLMLSGYFKYDIALIFWILLSHFFFLRFAKYSTNRNFLLAAIPTALAFSVKVSAVPLLLLYVISYFWFHFSWKKNLRYLFVGLTLFIGCVLLFGMPDTLFGRGNILLYLYENIVQGPAATSNFQIYKNPYQYLLLHHYPIIFGLGLIILFIVSCFFWLYLIFKSVLNRNLFQYKTELFIFFSLMMFAISLYPLQIWAAGNRSMVLLPFLVLIIGLTYNKFKLVSKSKLWLPLIFGLIFIIQTYFSFAWVYMRIVKSPQDISSEWIQKNMQRGTKIGIEAIPIYQELPDIIEKEYYFDQYKIKQNKKYIYQVIENKNTSLPQIIVLTNAEVNDKLLKQSPQKSLLRRIEGEKYKKIIVFSPDVTYSKIFASDEDYILSGLLAAPLTISIYRK